MTRTTGAAPHFNWRLAVIESQRRLEEPPRHPHSKRAAPVGDLVAAFALPIRLVPTTNGTRRKPDWWYAKHRDELWDAFLPQFLASGLRRGRALPGRPQVRCVRFDVKAPDACSDWAKSAVDRFIQPLWIVRKGIRVGCKRWGFLVDDCLDAADVCQWWEPSSKAASCAYFEIRTGE